MNNIPIATIGFGFGSDSLNELIKTYYTADSAIYIFNERYLTLFQCGQENCSGLSRESLDNLAIKYRRTGGKLVEERVDGGSFIIMRRFRQIPGCRWCRLRTVRNSISRAVSLPPGIFS